MRTMITNLVIIKATLIIFLCLSAAVALPADDSELDLFYKALHFVEPCPLQESDLNQAIQIAEDIFRKYPDSALGNTILGRAGYCMGVHDQSETRSEVLLSAQSYLLKALEKDPSLWETKFYLAETAVALKKYDMAMKLAKSLKKERPDGIESYHIAILIALDRKDYKELLRLCLDFKKRFVGGKTKEYLIPKLLTAYKGLNMLDEAEAIHLKLIEENYDKPWPLAFYAEFLIEYRKDYDKAMKYAERTIEMTGHDEAKRIYADACVGKGLVLYRQKHQPEKAEEYYETAVDIYPAHFEGWKQLTILNFELGIKNNDQKRLDKALVAGVMTRKIGFQDPAWDENLKKMAKELKQRP